MLRCVDDSLRALERTAIAEPGDDAAACAYLSALARATEELPAVEPFALGARSLLGPLFAEEAERLRSIDPSVVFSDVQGVAWVDASSDRGRALFAATLRVRLHQLDHLVREARASFGSWFAIHAALDADREAALARLGRVLEGPLSPAADRAAQLLAQRSEPEVGRRLARLARELPSELRPRLYAAIAGGRVPIDATARDDLRAAIARDAPAARTKAYAALARGASVDDLRKDHAHGPPEVRAAACMTLVTRLDRTQGQDLIRHALVDGDATVRLAGLQILGSSAWARHPKAGEWGMGRLLDNDRAVRHEALRLVRRYPLAARHLPNLKLVVERAPPGIRPGLQKLLEHHERRVR